MDTINSLFMECMCVSLFHPSSCFQHPALGYQCSFHFKPKTKVNFMAKWRKDEVRAAPPRPPVSIQIPKPTGRSELLHTFIQALLPNLWSSKLFFGSLWVPQRQCEVMPVLMLFQLLQYPFSNKPNNITLSLSDLSQQSSLTLVFYKNGKSLFFKI